MTHGIGVPGLLVVAGIALFWISMLGLLWRRSLVGMLVGLLLGWLSVAVAAIGFVGLRLETGERALGGTLVLCAVLIGTLQVAVGLAIVVARIKRHGTLDADDAGLLEG
jgi:NADH:ubiquinone oxidoreductase subunit K